jgi:hypothetical protein
VTGIVAAVRCNFCTRFLPAWRTHRFGTDANPAQTVCDDCLDWHMRALDLLAGNAVPGCQGCGASREKLRDLSPGVEFRLYVVPRDGIYQVLCAACVRPYVEKRRDLYRDTPFGTRQKL